MSNDSEKSLLLGDRVYARGSDGLHHACAVQGKKDNYYVIKFPDGSTKLECENDLTWLGFRGLPKSLWPKQPTVLVDGNSIKDEIKCFAGRAGKGGTNMLTNLRPRMLRLVRGGIVFLNDQEKTLRCSDPESRTQTRSSVLRLHPDLLEMKGARCEMKIISTISDDQTSSRNGWSSKAVSKSRAIMKTRSKVYDANGSSNVTEQRNDTTIQIDIPEIPLSESHITPVLEQNFKDTQLRLFDGTDLANEAFCDLTSPNLLAAWQPGPWYEPLTFELSPLSPPITPRPPNVSITLDCPPFETFYDSLPSESTFPIENTQLFEELVSGKRSKREMPKKCRKVYGIDNKKAWCTQCRWKKACTRFSG